jgi:hypothetical protein
LRAGAPEAVAFVGSPGVAVAAARDLAPATAVYAATGDLDAIRLAHALDAFGGGFGPDPAAAAFGARAIPCDRGTFHADYYRPGSGQLAALAAIALHPGG